MRDGDGIGLEQGWCAFEGDGDMLLVSEAGTEAEEEEVGDEMDWGRGWWVIGKSIGVLKRHEVV